jgi:hypothetical protein
MESGHLAEVSLAQGKPGQSPSPVSNVGGGHLEGMGQSLSIHRHMTFDSRDLLTGIIALVLGAVGVLHPLGSHDTETSFFWPTMAVSGRANQLFFKTSSSRESATESGFSLHCWKYW